METIIVLTDFSNTATNAARYVAALTHQLKVSKIIFFNAYEFKLVATDLPITAHAGLVASKNESLEKLALLKDELQPLVNHFTVLDYFTSQHSLIHAVNLLIQETNAEIVAMGITGMGGFERAIIGSNTINFVREISIPLLLVPHEATYQKINKILFATDLKIAFHRGALKIKNIANALNANLAILNIENKSDAHTNAALKREQSALIEALSDENTTFYFNEHQEVTTGILSFIKTHQVQLTIAIPKTYGFFEGLFHRSVTKNLTYKTPVPLLLIRE